MWLIEILLFVVFFVIKMTGHIDWSWWLVTCPLWLLPSLSLTLRYILKLLGPSEFNAS